MGTVPPQLVADLRFRLGIMRAVETGTFHGDGAATLAAVFPEVVTIELSPELHAAARHRFQADDRVHPVQGESGAELPRYVTPDVPTLYFLDAHWCGGMTAGESVDCAIREELDGLAGGNENDCLVIDDARIFEHGPPPPRDPSRWPSLPELISLIHRIHPHHYVTVVDDQVVAVPPRGRRIVEAWEQSVRTGKRPLGAHLWRLTPSRLRWRFSGRHF